ncbi:MAG: hypothetical protein RLZZ502_371 [Pseudomonadota bacterium]|jgi:hypothetical protein
MRDISDLLNNPSTRLDAQVLTHALATQLTGEQLRGEALTDLSSCQNIFERLAVEPVLLSPALAKENQALLTLANASSLASPGSAAPSFSSASAAVTEVASEPLVANDSWFGALLAKRSHAAALMLSAVLVFVAGGGAMFYTAYEHSVQLAAVKQANSVALEDYLKAHKELQQQGGPSINPHIHNASIRVTY